TAPIQTKMRPKRRCVAPPLTENSTIAPITRHAAPAATWVPILRICGSIIAPSPRFSWEPQGCGEVKLGRGRTCPTPPSSRGDEVLGAPEIPENESAAAEPTV